MVERTSQPLQLASGNLGQFGGYRPGQAREQQVQEESSLGMQALSGLLKIGGQVAEQAFQTDVKEAYMQGQRARMLGRSLEDEEADVLAKPFVRGGYQDQDYRVKQAELQQKMTAFIAGKGRTLPPEQFVAELARESSAVLESMGDGLSNVGREQALMAQTQLEETLIGAHSKANRLYGIEQMGARITTDGNAITLQMQQARASGDQAAYSEAAARATLFLEGVRTNPALADEDMRNEITLGFMQNLLAPGNDHQEVVQALMQPGPNGEPSALDHLPGAKRAKINEWLYASQGRTFSNDNLQNLVNDAEFEARLKDPEGTPISLSELQAQFAINATRNPRTANTKNEALAALWVKSHHDGQTNLEVLQALRRGDIGGLHTLGSSVEEASKLFFEQAAKRGVPLSTTVQALNKMTLPMGFVAPDVVNHVQKATRAMLLNPEAANPEQLGIITSFVDTVRNSADGTGESTLIGALDRDLQPMFQRMLVDGMAGMTPHESLQNSALMQTAREKLLPEQRTAKIKATTKAVQEHLTPNWFSQQLSKLDPTEAPIAVDSPEFQRYSAAVSQQAMALSQSPDYMFDKPETIAKLAAAQVASRTITLQVGDGAKNSFILPESSMAHYGLTSKGEKDWFVRAVGELYGKGIAGSEPRFGVYAGVLRVQQVVDGTPGPAVPVDMERINQRISDMKADAKASGTAPVVGYDHPVGNGASIRITGNSSTSLPRALVQGFRTQLLRDEAIKLTAYPDKTADGTVVGVAVGVGQNVTGKLKPGDKISPAEAELWFNESSDAALRAAEQEAKVWGVTDAAQIAAFGLAAFQMGPGGLRKFKDARAAYQARDWGRFEAEMRASDWYKQTPQRVETFLSRFKAGVDPAVSQHWMQR